MTTILVTGGIGSGKSAVCRYMESKGIPVYDSDSRARSLYDRVPGLAARVNESLGGGFLHPDGTIDRKKLASAVFSDSVLLSRLESIVHPEVLSDFVAWRSSHEDHAVVVMESAIALGLPEYRPLFDRVILVDAPEEIRLDRACRRDSSSREAIAARMSCQDFDMASVDDVVVNDSDLETLYSRVDALLEKM